MCKYSCWQGGSKQRALEVTQYYFMSFLSEKTLLCGTNCIFPRSPHLAFPTEKMFRRVFVIELNDVCAKLQSWRRAKYSSARRMFRTHESRNEEVEVSRISRLARETMLGIVVRDSADSEGRGLTMTLETVRGVVRDQWNLMWFCNALFLFNFYRAELTFLEARLPDSEGLRLSKPFVTLASRSSGVSNEHYRRRYRVRPLLHIGIFSTCRLPTQLSQLSRK